MKRRSFLQSTSAVSLPLMLNGMPLMAVGKNALSNLMEGYDDRILVLINLNGGNDGLSTLIPLSSYDNLANLRSDLLVPESRVLPLANDNGLHSSMGGFKEVWDKGKLNVVQSVGYPNQNRSHFRSTDIWQTASDAEEYLDTGWLGRFFQTDHPSYPEGYPNPDHPDPFALTIGGVVSETCQGDASTFSLALVDPENPGTIVPGVQDEVPDNCYGRELEYVREVANLSNAFSEVIKNAANRGDTRSNKYGNDAISRGLQTVATLISGGLKTRVYVLQHGGFDLHSGMVGDDPTQGRQSQLLQQLSDAVCAFVEDLEIMGRDKDVVGMTFSEFGRQIKQNESNGSDHGTAAPLFVFGSCVNPDILGDNPDIDRQVEDQAGVPMQYDFRSVYGSVLHQWFGVSESDVRDVLYDDFQMLPIIEGCTIVNTDDLETGGVEMVAFPNPCVDYCTVKVEQDGSPVQLSLFDTRGAQLQQIAQGSSSAGLKEYQIDMRSYPPGTYYIRYASGSRQKTLKMMKN